MDPIEGDLVTAATLAPVDKVAWLLDAVTVPVDSRAPDALGETPLLRAVRELRMDVAVLLVAHGADMNARDSLGRTCLILAAQRGDRAMVDFCLEHNAQIEARDCQGRTALHWAAVHNHRDAVLALLAKDASFDVLDNGGQTAAAFSCVAQAEKVQPVLAERREDELTAHRAQKAREEDELNARIQALLAPPADAKKKRAKPKSVPKRR